jgi:GNAT superfamily N-acetyltransferase
MKEKEWMNYTVKPLDSSNGEVFTDFLGNLDFSLTPHWATCFCRFYYSDCSIEEWAAKSGETNKAEALEDIRKGNMKGYLAFDGDKCIGWCSANDIVRFPRLSEDVSHLIEGKRTGCTICYVIHPEYRRQGVARLLLQYAVKDFKQKGFDHLLAFPVVADTPAETHYRGSVNMYLENGFQEIGNQDNVKAMLLELN